MSVLVITHPHEVITVVHEFAAAAAADGKANKTALKAKIRLQQAILRTMTRLTLTVNSPLSRTLEWRQGILSFAVDN
jgi:hypothetical protein